MDIYSESTREALDRLGLPLDEDIQVSERVRKQRERDADLSQAAQDKRAGRRNKRAAL